MGRQPHVLEPGPIRSALGRHQPAHRLQGLESLRGVAAMMIVLGHAIGFAGPSLPPHLQFIANNFWLGVPLFFTLSGFVLSYEYAAKLDSRESVVEFYLRRFFRIAPLFYVLIPVWLVIDALYGRFHSPQALFLNIALLFGLVPGAHESMVPAGWTIGVEVIFYAIFPVTALLIGSVRSAAAFVVFGVLASAAAFDTLESGATTGSYAHMNLLTYLPYFAGASSATGYGAGWASSDVAAAQYSWSSRQGSP